MRHVGREWDAECRQRNAGVAYSQAAAPACPQSRVMIVNPIGAGGDWFRAREGQRSVQRRRVVMLATIQSSIRTLIWITVGLETTGGFGQMFLFPLWVEGAMLATATRGRSLVRAWEDRLIHGAGHRHRCEPREMQVSR
jgi:hypothetical protein